MKLLNLIIAIGILNCFAYLTIRLRPKLFKVSLFKPMIWNFKLSLLPMLILILSTGGYLGFMWLAAYFETSFLVFIAYGFLMIGLILWILTLPNSGYLITELNMTHRNSDGAEVPIWYDIVSILSFAMSGIANTLLNIVFLQLIFLVGVDPAQLTHSDYQSFIITAVLINTLVAIGVYFGRQIRFNSWDVLHPKSFINKLRTHFNASRVWKECALFIVMHATFFMIMYFVFGIPNIFI